MIKAKVCGITNNDDALLAANLGYDFLGLNFWKDSPRKVSVANAKEIVSKLPPFISAVGVFVDEDSAVLAKTIKKAALWTVQLHGAESPDYCRQIADDCGVTVIKAFRIASEADIEAMQPYRDAVKYFLLDAFVPGQPGGTGETFNWDLAVKAKDLGVPVFLAGGLTPDNIEEAIEKVMPFGVDTASGVERLTRKKDYDKMTRFIRSARNLR